jgi:hypothetical protein
MAKQYIIEGVEALWPKLDRTYVFDQKVKRSVPCDPRDQNAEFSMAFRMDKTVAQALFAAMKEHYAANKEGKWPEKLENPFVKDDNGTYTHKTTLKGAYRGEVTSKPTQFDSTGSQLADDFRLTTGSTVNIAVTFYAYDFNNKINVSLRLRAVQVIKYTPGEAQNPFGAVEGGYVQEDTHPFAPKPTASSAPSIQVVEADEEEEEDDFEAPPVKRKSAKTETPAASSDDLSSILDDWED